MPFKISRSYLDGYKPSTRAGLSAGSSKSSRSARIQSAATIGGTAFALGFVEGKYGMPAIPGVGLTADLIGAVALHALGFFGKLPAKYNGIATDVANGALAYWAGVQGHLVADKTGGKAAGVRGESLALGQGARPAIPSEQVWQTQFR